jgi:hypothetical protein
MIRNWRNKLNRLTDLKRSDQTEPAPQNKAPLMKKVILRTPKRTKSNSFSATLF